MVKVCAHRGNWMEAPENTLPAIQSAIDIGCDLIEIDVHISKDRKLVVTHDHNLKRLFDRNAEIKDLNYSELIDIKDKFMGLSIPLLAQVLELIKKSNVILNIEIKAYGMEKTILQLVKERNLENQVVYSSFNMDSLQNIKDLDQKSVVCSLSDQFELNKLDYYIKRAKNLKATYMNMHYRTITEDVFEIVSKNGMKIMAWTVDSPKEMKRLIRMNIDTIITNNPEILIEIIKK